MTFWTGAIGLALLACLLLLLPASRRSLVQDRQRLNLRLQREQLAALDREFAAGSLARDEHRAATAEVERAVLDEADAQNRSAASDGVRQHGSPVSRQLAAALSLAIAAVAFGLYGFLGNMEGIDVLPAGNSADDSKPTTGATGNLSATTATSGADASTASTAAVEAMLDSMAERMASQREGTVDAAGWSLVARSYAALQRFDRASEAYARAIVLAPNDAQLLADQSDVLSMLQGGRMSGEPIRLATRALQIDPANLKALALAGSEAFERDDLAAAEGFWRHARRLSAPGEFADGIDRNLATVKAAQANPPAPASQAGVSTAARARLRIGGRLQVAPELAGRIAPTDEVFVFAREPGTAGMPIAIARYSAKDLPVDFVLDASSAMVDQTRLAKVSRLEIGARISKTGDATPRTGDLRGKSQPVAIDQGDLTLTIDDVTP